MATLHEEPPTSMQRYLWLLAMCCIRLSASVVCSSGASLPEIRQLTVGDELTWEKLPLRNGKCIYELLGLQIFKHYEVKISYPATIPAMFSLTLVDDLPVGTTSVGRKLLNTEKIVFSTAPDSNRFTKPTDSPRCKQKLDEFWKGGVMVTVEPEGYVAMLDVEDQELIFYNILCEEVIYGLPKQTWWMAFLVILALSGTILVSSLLFKLLMTGTDLKAKAV